MKLTITTGTWHGKRGVVARAIVYTKGKRRQKTWMLESVAPDFTLKEQTPALEAEARRWEQTILNPVIGKLPVQEDLI